MEEGASAPRWALDKKLGDDVSMEEKKERRYCRGEMEIYVIGRVFQVCKKKNLIK